jgi:hypothetical protein
MSNSLCPTIRESFLLKPVFVTFTKVLVGATLRPQSCTTYNPPPRPQIRKQEFYCRVRIFKFMRSPGIDSEESIPPSWRTWRWPYSYSIAVGPIRYRLRLHTVPTAIVMILPRTFPLSADPGEVFFIISILKQTSRYRRR